MKFGEFVKAVFQEFPEEEKVSLEDLMDREVIFLTDDGIEHNLVCTYVDTDDDVVLYISEEL